MLGRGLVADPGARVAPPKRAVDWQWQDEAEGGYLCGPIFLAAHVASKHDPWLERAGMGFAQIDQFGSMACGAGSPVPGLLQDKGLAEVLVAAEAMALS